MVLTGWDGVDDSHETSGSRILSADGSGIWDLTMLCVWHERNEFVRNGLIENFDFSFRVGMKTPPKK